jgi:Flp pilus assembly protein TadG
MAQIVAPNVDSGERGAALLELALVLPLLLVVTAGIVDFGFAFQRYEVVTNAAREGARLASMSGYDDAFVSERARQYVKQGLNLSDAALEQVMPAANCVSVSHPDVTINLSGGGSVVAATTRVDAFYHHQFMLLGPIMGLINASWGQSITLKSSSVMRIQATGAGGS